MFNVMARVDRGVLTTSDQGRQQEQGAGAEIDVGEREEEQGQGQGQGDEESAVDGASGSGGIAAKNRELVMSAGE